MKKFVLLFMVSGFMMMNSYAQVASYTFTQATTTYTEITTGTVLGTATTDEEYFLNPAVLAGSTTVTTGPGFPIGFNFIYNGNTYDRFGVHANGWVCLGQSALAPNPINMQSGVTNQPISTTSTAPAVLQDRVSVFGRNLAAQANAELRFDTIGTAPNRTLVIQWKGYRRNGTTGENFNFQIRLYETTNVVEFIYGAVTVNANNATAPQIGLRGSAATDFNNRTTTTDWAATTAGAVNTASVSITMTVFPTPGLIYRWTPPVVYQYDAGITAINAPTGVIPAGATNVSATIKNFGTANLTGASIAWRVDGVLQTAFPYSNAGLPQNSSDGPVVIGTYNFLTAGSHTIKAWPENPNGNADQNHANDTTTKTVYVQGYGNLPYFQNFDATWIDKLNTHDVPDQYWINTPVTGNNSWRRNDDGVSGAWTFIGGGAYNPTGANTTANSARFHTAAGTIGTGYLDLYLNFAPVGNKLLKFWNINTSGADSLTVSMSTDAGTTFSVIQKAAINAAWTEYQVPLGASVSTNVILRFSATSVAGNNTDVGLDEVSVMLITPLDAGITAITNPGAITYGNVPVSVTLKNFGSDTLHTASLNWTVDGIAQTPFSYTNTTGVAPNGTDGPVSIGSYNFTIAGNHTIKAWTSSPNGGTDGDHTNDTTTKTVYVQAYTLIPYTQNFDATWINKFNTREVPDQYWINTPLTGNNSWRRDDDGAAAAWTGVAGAYTPTGANTTANSARFHSTTATAGTLGILDLYANCSPAGSKLLKFWFNNTNGTDSLAVSMSTDGGATFTVLQKYNTNTAWTLYQIPLGPIVSPTVVIRFAAKTIAGGQTTDIGLDEVSITIVTADDAGVTAIDSPGTIVAGITPVSVTIKNFGSASLTSAGIAWSVDGVGQTPASYTNGTGLAPNTTDGPISLGNYNFSVAGPHIIKAWTTLPNGGTDGDHSNDTTSKSVYVQSYCTVPYYQGFDNTWIDKLSTHDAPEACWMNTPATGNNSWRRDDDGATAGWLAGGTYTAGTGANGTLHSARFHSSGAGAGNNGTFDLYLDFTTPGNKLLKFWQANTGGGDSLYISISTNAGATFTVIQRINTNAAWTQYQIPLGNSVSSTVVIRFFAFSAASQSDVGLDEVEVVIPVPNDAGVIAINSPTGVVLGVTPVNVTVENFGSDSLHTASIQWSVDGNLQTPFAYTNVPGLTTLATDGPVMIGNYNFVTTGSHLIKAWTASPNGGTDGNHVNDTSVRTVYVQAYGPIPYYMSFDSTWMSKLNTHDAPDAYWINTPVTGNNSWRRNDDGATAAWTAIGTGVYTPTGANTTASSARFHTGGGVSGLTGILDLYLDFTTVGTKLLKFWHINTAGTDSLTVSMSTDAGSTFNIIQKVAVDAAWTEYQVTLGTSVAPNVILRFAATGNLNGNTDVGLDQVSVTLLTPNDAGVISIDAPTGVVSGNLPVSVTVENFGLDSLMGANIQWAVDGNLQTQYAYSNIPGLPTFGTDGPVIIGNYNFVTVGAHLIKAWTTSPNGGADNNHANDTASRTVYVQGYGPIPYYISFDSVWMDKLNTNDAPDIWWINTPETGNNSWRRDDDGATAGWVAGGTYNAGPGANGTAHSARFHSSGAGAGNNGQLDLYLDFTTPGSKILRFWQANTGGGDSLYISMSTDGGATFNMLQQINTNPGWTFYQVPLGASTSPTVVLRFYTLSAASQSDIGLDEVEVTILSPNDVGATAILTPQSSICGSTGDSVIAIVYNYGSADQTSVPVVAQISGPSGNIQLNATIPGTLVASTADTVFLGTINTTIPGTYNVTVYTSLSTDADHTNDTVYGTFDIQMPLSVPHLEDFEGVPNALANWNTNFITGAGHGNSSVVMYRTLSNMNNTGSAAMNKKVGPITNLSVLGFDYRIVNAQGPAIATPLINDSISVFISSDCGVTNDLVYLIDSANHVPSVFLKHIVVPLATYAGYDVIPSFYVVRNNTVNYYLDFDNVAIYNLPSANAGPNQYLCYLDTLSIVSAAATDYSTSYWTTSGDGAFVDSTILNPQYVPGSADITNGTVDLTLTVIGPYSDTATSVITVTITTTATANAGGDVVTCEGTPTQLSATGGNTFSWYPTTGLDNPNIANPMASPNSTIIYTVTVTSSCGVASDDVVVGVDHIIAPNLGGDTTLCSDQSITLNAGSNYSSYLWSTMYTGQSITLSGPTMGLGNFLYSVTVTSGVCEASDGISITFIDCSGIAENSDNASLQIFPNPTDGLINIAVDGVAADAEIAIFNLQGQLVFSGRLNGETFLQLDLSDRPTGVYAIRLRDDKRSIVAKFVKN